MCGPIFDGVDEYIMEQQREAREKVIDRRLDIWDMGLGSALGVKVEISEEIVEHLVEELTQEIL